MQREQNNLQIFIAYSGGVCDTVYMMKTDQVQPRTLTAIFDPQSVANTLSFFQASRFHTPEQLGRITLHQAAELMDAISCIRVVCEHAFQRHNGQPMPAHFVGVLDLLKGSDLTLAQAARVLKLWHRWTHQFHGEQVPDVSAVQGFIWALRGL